VAQDDLRDDEETGEDDPQGEGEEEEEDGPATEADPFAERGQDDDLP